MLYRILTVYAQLEQQNQILREDCNYDRSGQYFINNGCSFVIVNFEYFNGKGEDLEQRGNTSQKTLFTGT